MEAEGVTFHCNVNVGVDISIKKLERSHDAVLLAGGAEKPRDLPVEGRDLKGVHFAMDFLPQQNRRVSAEPLGGVEPIMATGKNVVVIGGGDTGSDCIGTSFRQGALSVTQLEIMPMPPEKENKALTWPQLAAQASHLVEPGRRRASRFQRRHQPLPWRRRRRPSARMHQARRSAEAGSRHRVPLAGGARAARHGLRLSGA